MSDASYKIGGGSVVLAIFYKSDYLTVFVKDGMIKVQFSKYAVLKFTCEPDSIPDLMNKDSEITALKFGL